MKKTAFLALPFAATLALTGCGALGSPAASPTATTQAAAPTSEAATPSAVAPAPTAVAPAPTSEVAPATTATPVAPAPSTGASELPAGADYTPAAGSGQLTDAQLTSVMEYVKSSFPSTGAVAKDSAAIKATLPMAAALAEKMDVEPASCGTLASSSTPDSMASLTLAGLSWPGTELGTSNTVGINSYPSAAAASAAAQESKSVVALCPTFTMNMAGLKANVTTQPDNAYQGAPGFVDAWVKTVEMEGVSTNTATVTYIEGNSVVTATASGKGEGSALLTDAEMMVATTLGGIKENS